jgi:hypothetical protein
MRWCRQPVKVGALIVAAWLSQFALGFAQPVASTPPPNNASASLKGKLFFDQTERDQLDKPTVDLIALGMPIRKLTPLGPSVINGFVKRSDNVATVWVDNQMRGGINYERVEAIDPRDVSGGVAGFKDEHTTDDSKSSKISRSNLGKQGMRVNKRATRRK